MAEPESSASIKVTVKTPKEKHTFDVESSSTVLKFKEEISGTFEAAVPQLCLIFAGKILKDADTLTTAGIKDGLTIHLVIKSNKPNTAPASSQSSSTPAAAPPPPSSQPTAPQGLPNLASMMGGGGGLGGNLAEVQARMMRDPDAMRQMMDNPMVQSIMSNPDMMRMMITSNPQMRELMERNPELNSMLNNPALMRQAMDMMRNPAAMQEMMRQQDRAMSNLESLPGGMNHLQRIYRDIQEPLMNASAASRPNPFADLANSGSTDANPQQGMENNQPLPNPWGPSTPSTGSSTTPTATTTSGTTGTTPTTGGTSGTAPGLAGMFNSPGMQSYMQQMMSNPELMQNMMSGPYMQSMAQQMQSNPELAQSLLANNPMFAGNPEMRERMAAQLPQMIQQMQNPAMQSAMSNPRALEAMMQIQRGIAQLQQEAPGLVSPGGMMGMPGVPPTTSASTPPAATTTNTTSSTTTPAAGTAIQPDMMAQMAQMMQMMGGTGNAGVTTQTPEQRFAAQLEQLANMGFVDRQANIQALQATMGDVNAAIDRLLQQR